MSKNDPFYQNTKQSYETNLDSFHQILKDAHVLLFKAFSAALPHGTFVVDLGCGTGRDSKPFIDSGHLYLGIDVSEKMIEKARKTHPYARFEVKDIRGLSFKENSVDAFWGVDALYHLSKEDFTEFLAKTYKWLRQGGQMFLVFKRGQGEKLERDPLHPTSSFFTSYYEPVEIEKLATDAGFEIKSLNVMGRAELQGSAGQRYDPREVVVAWLIKPQTNP